MIVVFLFSIGMQAQIKIGDQLPSFTLKNTLNQEVNSNEFKGKWILFDFWASWCAPCRIANKKMVKLYDEIDHNKLEIVGISVDKDEEKWKKAILKDKIKYAQLIDPKGFNAKTALLFGVEELPTTFLFNSEGKLIAINPTEEEITNYIK